MLLWTVTFRRERMILIKPGFSEHLIAHLQEKTHLHWVVSIHDQIEFGSPKTGYAARDFLGVRIRKCAA